LPSWSILGTELGLLIGAGFGMSSQGEYAVAVLFWLFVCFIWIVKAFDWRKSDGTHRSIFLKVLSLAVAIVLCSYFIIVTDLRRGDENWSNLQSLWQRIPLPPKMIESPPSADDLKTELLAGLHESINPKVTYTQPQEPARGKTNTSPVSPRIGTGPDAYKDIPDDQLGQMAIDEADKIDGMVNASIYVSQAPPMTQKERMQYTIFQDHIFAEKLIKCCAQQVTDLRMEILRRLGAPGEDLEEDESYQEVFRKQSTSQGVPLPSWDPDIQPLPVRTYASLLRRLGAKMKLKTVRDLGPIELHFSEQERLQPSGLRYVTTSIETESARESGYILIEYTGTPGNLGCDLPDVSYPFLMVDDIVNPKLKAWLTKRPRNPFHILKIGETPFLPGKPIRFFEYGSKDFLVTRVVFFASD
jgi:hypothetical protein